MKRKKRNLRSPGQETPNTSMRTSGKKKKKRKDHEPMIKKNFKKKITLTAQGTSESGRMAT
jgi:hypothetical protein